MSEEGKNILIVILGLFAGLFRLGERVSAVVGIVFCTLRFIGLISWGWLYVLLPFIILAGAWLLEWGLNLTVGSMGLEDEEE